MRKLVTLIASAEQGNALATAMAGFAAVNRCMGRDELLSLATDPDVVAVVADVRDSMGVSTVPELLELQRASPSIRMIVLGSMSPSNAHEVVRLATAGCRARWVLAPFESLQAEIELALGEEVAHGPEVRIFQNCADALRTPVRSFLVHATIGSARPTAVRIVADTMGTSSRSLERLLRRVGMPAPKHVLDWCRVLHVEWQLDVLNRSGKRAAGVLAFPSQSAMNNLVHRMTGQSPMRMREAAGFYSLLERFVKLLGAGRS